MWFQEFSRVSRPLQQGMLLGLELEIEGSRIMQASNGLPSEHWIVERDGSLREGLELKSRGGKDYNTTINMVGEYRDFLSKCSARATARTSVHIHLNTQGLTKEQMKSLVWLSVAMEPVILRFCSPLRNHNGYCVPVYNSVNLAGYWRKVIDYCNGGIPAGELATQERYKYAATGAYRLMDLGTIEYRMFPGCTDASKLAWYVDIVKSLYDVAVSASLDSLRDKKLSEGLLSIITGVIIDNRKSVTLTELESLLEIGIQMANDIVRTKVTRADVVDMHAKLFPSKYKPVTKDTLTDLYKSTDIKAELKNYDPDELAEALKGKAYETYKFLSEQDPDNPAKAASFIQTLIQAEIIKP